MCRFCLVLLSDAFSLESAVLAYYAKPISLDLAFEPDQSARKFVLLFQAQFLNAKSGLGEGGL